MSAPGTAALDLATAPRRQSSTLSRARPLILARGASAAMTFTIPLVLARMLNATEYGTYKQFVLVAQTLFSVLPFGIVQSLYYFLPRNEHRRAYLCQTHLFIGVTASLAALSIVIFGGPMSRALGNPELAHLRLWLALYAAGLVASLPFEITFTARARTGTAALTYLVSDFFRTVVMTVPVLLGFGLLGLCVGLAAWASARWIATLLLTLRGEKGAAFNREAWREQVRYAIPFGAAMAVAVPQNYFHQYAVSASVSAAAFAMYSVGCFQLPLVDLLYVPTTEILMVRIGELDAEQRSAEGVTVFREASSRLLLLFVPLALFLFAAANDFIPALFTERYLNAVSVFRIAVWAVVFAGFPVDGALRARKRTRDIFKSYMIKALFAVPMVLVGLHFLGIHGAILAWLMGEILGKALLMARLPAAMQAPMRALVPWRELGQSVGAGVLAAASVVVFAWASPHARHLLRLAAEALVFGVVYAAALAALGAQPLQRVREFVR